MVLMKQNECALKVSDQMHIHLPPEAFTNQATNFWVGILFGVGLTVALLAAMANQ